jgi:hypothetical protein
VELHFLGPSATEHLSFVVDAIEGFILDGGFADSVCPPIYVWYYATLSWRSGEIYLQNLIVDLSPLMEAQVEILVACSHCVAHGDPHWFTLEECDEAILKANTGLCLPNPTFIFRRLFLRTDWSRKHSENTHPRCREWTPSNAPA